MLTEALNLRMPLCRVIESGSCCKVIIQLSGARIHAVCSCMLELRTLYSLSCTTSNITTPLSITTPWWPLPLRQAVLFCLIVSVAAVSNTTCSGPCRLYTCGPANMVGRCLNRLPSPPVWYSTTSKERKTQMFVAHHLHRQTHCCRHCFRCCCYLTQHHHRQQRLLSAALHLQTVPPLAALCGLLLLAESHQQLLYWVDFLCHLQAAGCPDSWWRLVEVLIVKEHLGAPNLQQIEQHLQRWLQCTVCTACICITPCAHIQLFASLYRFGKTHVHGQGPGL